MTETKEKLTEETNLYQNSQWKIVDERIRYGWNASEFIKWKIMVEQVDGSYWFNAMQLFQDALTDWNIIDQLATKDWVDPVALKEACMQAKVFMVAEYPELRNKPCFDLSGAIDGHVWRKVNDRQLKQGGF